jgi:hypothetical protein
VAQVTSAVSGVYAVSMTAENDDDPIDLGAIPAAGHLPSLSRPRHAGVRQGRTESVDDVATLRRTELRIAELQAAWARRTNPSEHDLRSAREELERLRAARDFLEVKLGPTRVHAGMVLRYHLNGNAYVFAPYQAWYRDYMVTTNAALPQLTGPDARRDQLIWILWHLKGKAEILIGRLNSKSRGGIVVCTECLYRHPALRRPRDERGVGHCPRCKALPHRDVTRPFSTKNFGVISKVALSRRFRVSRRHVDWIVSLRPD